MTETIEKRTIERGTHRAYETLRNFITQIGGEMTWRSMGRGGDWLLNIHGKTAVIACRDNRVNALDYCYVAKVPTPQTWDDYDNDAPLAANAFWTLIDIVR